jgi:hypothetical protein
MRGTVRTAHSGILIYGRRGSCIVNNQFRAGQGYWARNSVRRDDGCWFLDARRRGATVDRTKDGVDRGRDGGGIGGTLCYANHGAIKKAVVFERRG